MIKVGIVGLGRMGMSHCAIVRAQTDADVIAVCEPSVFVASAVKKYAGIPFYKDYRKMIDSVDLDCVFITTPTRFHFEMVDYALDAGLHVFVEKPFCLNPEHGEYLVKKASTKGLVNQVGYHNRFIGTFREAKRIVAEGEIGDVYHVLGEAYGPVVLKESGKTWRSNTNEGGGCLYDYATHVVNLIGFVFEHPKSVSGTILQSVYSCDVDDTVFSTLHFKNGVFGRLSVNWSDETYRKMSTQLTIFGKRGKIIVDAQELKVYFRNTPNNVYEKGWNMRWVTDLSPEVGFYLRGEEYSAQIEYFFDCIKNLTNDNVNSFECAHTTDCVVNMLRTDGNMRKVA
ncbi:oxidoreductase [Desulfosarcina ovata subsp. sediminis]|uniref:Oxidoreductase n=1 Tax=Desulfosarcina ovata subsp. sediminis TaxID=885957 RepID=A0A5K7ZME2_9BACT|nr:Gfo/Idh/MocA family oxidoreductase [Desulfosarcina ovata]BBO81297.1 oxidoreductase [Desulfosarcina ovata subsp. sediminis]